MSGCADRDTILSLCAAREERELSSFEDKRLKTHLAECADCRDEAVALDPLLLFTPLAATFDSAERKARDTRAVGRAVSRRTADLEPDSKEARDVRKVVGDVLAAVEMERARRRLLGADTRRWWISAPHALRAPRSPLLYAASFAILAAGASVILSQRAYHPAAGVAARSRSYRALAAGESAPPPAPQARPVVEEIQNPGAVVYQFPASTQEEPTVVFVVDHNADI